MDIRKANNDEISLIVEMTRQLFKDEPSDMVVSDEEFGDRLQKYTGNGCNAFLFIEETVIGYALVNMMQLLSFKNLAQRALYQERGGKFNVY